MLQLRYMKKAAHLDSTYGEQRPGFINHDDSGLTGPGEAIPSRKKSTELKGENEHEIHSPPEKANTVRQKEIEIRIRFDSIKPGGPLQMIVED